MAKVHPEAAKFLDNNTIDAEIYKFLDVLNHYEGIIFTGTNFADSL